MVVAARRLCCWEESVWFPGGWFSGVGGLHWLVRRELGLGRMVRPVCSCVGAAGFAYTCIARVVFKLTSVDVSRLKECIRLIMDHCRAT